MPTQIPFQRRHTHVLLALVVGAALVFPSISRSGDDIQKTRWPIFRGTPQLTGHTSVNIPQEPALQWTYKTGKAIKGGAVISENRVYVGSRDGNLYALKLTSGESVWTFEAGDPIDAAPLLYQGSVYVGTTEGVFYAIDAETGEEQWRYETGNKIAGSANWTGSSPDGSAKILFGSYDYKLHCVEADTGDRIWTYETDNYVNGTPGIYGEYAVVAGCDAHLHIVDLNDGEAADRIDNGAYIAGSVALTNDRSFVGHYQNQVVATDLKQREISWRYGDKGEGDPFFSSPAVADDRIVIGSRDGHLYCLSQETGDLAWTFRTGDAVDSSPVITHKHVVFGSTDGRIYSVLFDNGRFEWRYQIGAAITATPAVTEGWIVIGAEDGRIYAFGENE